MAQKISDRIKLVLDNVYGGSLERMANDLGVNRTTVLRYRDGGIVPPLRNLIVLSALQNIELGWLENGGSSDIQFKQLSSSASIEEFGLPVFAHPVRDQKAESGQFQLGMKMLAPPPYYGEKRYWLKIAKPIEGESVQRGDFILIDPIAPRAILGSESGELRAYLESDEPKFGILPAPADEVRVIGLPVLLHRDLLA